MPAVTTALIPSTCGHIQTGSPDVTIEGRGISRVGDFAGGAIIGPGNPSITVNGLPISVEGDSITSHGKNKHKVSKTVAGQSSVNAG